MHWVCFDFLEIGMSMLQCTISNLYGQSEIKGIESLY